MPVNVNGGPASNPYLIQSNLDTCSFTLGNPPAVISAGSIGTWGTITGTQIIALGNKWIADGRPPSISLNDLLQLPRKWQDGSNYGIIIDNTTSGTGTVWDGELVVQYWTPFGVLKSMTVDLSIPLLPALLEVLSTVVSVDFFPASTWALTAPTNLVFNRTNSGISKVFVPDPRTTSFQASLQVAAYNVTMPYDMAYSIYQSLSPIWIWDNTSTIDRGPNQTANYPDAINLLRSPEVNKFAVDPAFLALNTSSILKLDLVANAYWVEFGQINPTLGATFPSYQITFLQNGRWNR